MWVVYDASARAGPSAPSLNDCLNSGPTLQNKLWDVLIQQRAFPVMVSSDIRQALLQIRVKEADRMYYDFIGVRMIVHPLRDVAFHMSYFRSCTVAIPSTGSDRITSVRLVGKLVRR